MLEVQNLTVSYTPDAPALRDVSLHVDSGEVVALTGPSGSGKTTLALAILQVLPANSSQAGSIQFDGIELRESSARALRAIRGDAITCIPQQPALALHPLIRVGRQVENVLKSHGRYTSRSREEVIELFHRFGLGDECFQKYPHQLSGGQLQRAAIIQSLVCRPRLLIADEPFAAQDAVTRRGIIDLFRTIKQTFAPGILLISHDRQVVSALADRVATLKNGGIN